MFPWLAWVNETVLFIETASMITGYTSQLPNITNGMLKEKKQHMHTLPVCVEQTAQ